jgi:hypothetical protein
LLLFQSTLPQGERQINHLQNIIDEVFQSTLPQGERQFQQIAKKILELTGQGHEPGKA